jgi:tetratricopeptide (TPR) repeat protein
MIKLFPNDIVVELNLTKLSVRFLFGLLVAVGCGLLLVVIVSRFVIGTLADDRLAVTRAMLKVPVEYFPGSARLNARLAAAELSESDRDLASAKLHAERAISLSPFDHRFRLTLASIDEAAGDRRAAEAALRTACALAPNYWSVRYRLANVLVRGGKLAEAISEFRSAIAANETLTAGAIDLVWRATGEDLAAVRSLCEGNQRAKLKLARFLVGRSRPDEAAEVFATVDLEVRTSESPESSALLNALIAAGRLKAARDLWSEMAGADRVSLIWNGGFESDIKKDLAQFDWSFGRSEYARLSIDSSAAHSGSRALKIEFAGRDTTILDNEIRQLTYVRAGGRYEVECYYKTRAFEAPEGPRIVVTDERSNWIAASEPVPPGSDDWRRLSFEFTAPQSGTGGVIISIKRKPRFSYDEPTRGSVWFDDLVMRQQ